MRSSSAVEQVTVNHFVAGSIPAFAAFLINETMYILKSKYHGSTWNNIEVTPLRVKDLWASVPKAEKHKGKEFFQPVMDDIKENGLHFPLLVVHSTHEQLLEQKSKYRNRMMDVPSDNGEKLYVVWGGSNRWHVANDLGFEYVDCVIFHNGEFDDARNMQGLHRKPYQKKFY